MKAIFLTVIVLFFTLFVHSQNKIYHDTQLPNRYTEYKYIIKKILNDDDLFVMFYMDAALIVDPNAEIQVVKQIKTKNPWNSLKEYLNNKSNIYFCPSSKYLNVAVEYMPCPNDKNVIMSDRYGMYRLSSPEELFKNRGEAFLRRRHKAVIFGGLDYNNVDEGIDTLLAFRGNRSAGGYGELTNAYNEAVYIDSLLRKKGIEVALLNGKQGCEQKFYEISTSNADILHIASHGEYKPEEDNEHSNSFEEWMMSHSALILSGYNQNLKEKDNDGRLTAYEISQTDLSNIKLAVLSACETGQGDIKENDVYGLLKGFKKAGAGTLMLSLSTVNDEPTSLLMKRFYENLFRGDNPRRALENAQMFLRQYLQTYKEGKYKDSLDWKKFILVDDLDRNIGLEITKEEKDYFLNNIVGLKDLYSAIQFFPEWNRIRQKLKAKDKVIRFFSYMVTKGGSKYVQYLALIGDVKTGKCTIKRLFRIDENNISDYSFSFNRIDRFDSIVWQPIIHEIQDCHRLFFQATGILNTTPIECFPSVLDSYETYRISSLCTLLEKRTMYNKNNILALFGGLNYYCEEENEEKNITIKLPTRDAREEISYLPSTLVEIGMINEIATQARQKTIMLTECSGTENELINLTTNHQISALHFSTHGFAAIERGTNCVTSTISDYLLGNCGLLLSGAGDHINYINDFCSNEDGILTGAKVIKLNLQNIDLVTLSACETNIGDLDDFIAIASDYNWSLAYAFKIAGTKTVLCSVGKVADEPTSKLMIEFYRNWYSNGMCPRNALEKARLMLRKSKKWNNPEYWAAFILLDALD